MELYNRLIVYSYLLFPISYQLSVISEFNNHIIISKINSKFVKESYLKLEIVLFFAVVFKLWISVFNKYISFILHIQINGSNSYSYSSSISRIGNTGKSRAQENANDLGRCFWHRVGYSSQNVKEYQLLVVFRHFGCKKTR